MASAFLTVLGQVPWGTVVDTLPKVVDQATRLIGLTKKSATSLEDAAAQPAESTDLKAEIEHMEEALGALSAQLADAGGLIRILAQSNEAMVARIAMQQRWLVLSLVLAFVSFALAAVSIAVR